MVHNELIRLFKEICHISDESIDIWFANGKNSVRVRMKDHTELVFTYESPRMWKLETRGMHLMGH